jgi:hypothetical protein
LRDDGGTAGSWTRDDFQRGISGAPKQILGVRATSANIRLEQELSIALFTTGNLAAQPILFEERLEQATRRAQLNPGRCLLSCCSTLTAFSA